MSSIKAFECLTGHISGLCTLSGKLTCFGSLSGKLSAVIDFNAYSGEYEVVPNAFNTQVLPTANKVLKKDIVVQKVPYFETSNNSKDLKLTTRVEFKLKVLAHLMLILRMPPLSLLKSCLERLRM